MTIVDLTIVNVALPTIGGDLHVSESDLQWVVTAYGITFGGFSFVPISIADLAGIAKREAGFASGLLKTS
jgi:MFS family permease